MRDLLEKTCPYETAQQVCVVNSSAVGWRIVSLDVAFAFPGTNDFDNFISNDTPNSRTGGNLSLSFIVNSTLNSLVISCYFCYFSCTMSKLNIKYHM